ncbi:Uncharacterised protein [Mycobacterium tuberculosis]|nr:Uncharacterised protein [Mycobacterium tuberculosis]
MLPWVLSKVIARPVNGPSGSTVAPRVELTSRMRSTMSAGLMVAIALSLGSLTRCKASRSAWAKGSGVTHVRWTSVRNRSSQLDAAAWPVPGWVGVPGS